jgi:hypothetical protein
MKLKDIIEKLELKTVTNNGNFDNEVTGAYSSDLLSDVIANSKKDNVWITLQTHINIIAVAALKELTAIIIVMNKKIDSDTLEKANSEKIILLQTKLNSFQICGKLYEMGIR